MSMHDGKIYRGLTVRMHVNVRGGEVSDVREFGISYCKCPQSTVAKNSQFCMHVYSIEFLENIG